MNIEQLHAFIGGEIIEYDGSNAIAIKYASLTGPVYERIVTSGHKIMPMRVGCSISIVVI